ncbi:hypothetical protein BLOT_004266 [Blomia tropicalis]|nr:hypothetical protein BLOT_004266 [Blomia tropicalis]
MVNMAIQLGHIVQNIKLLLAIFPILMVVNGQLLKLEESIPTSMIMGKSNENGNGGLTAPSDGKSSIKTALLDNDELSIMSKRRSGFMPSRGKKGQESFEAINGGGLFDIPDSARDEFMQEVDKRASGFLPMRGRKSMNSYPYDEFIGDLLEKRRGSQFMPMRGRKWSPISDGVPMAMSLPSTANGWYPRYYHPIPFGTTGNLASAYLPNNIDGEQIMADSFDVDKRKGVGFFGSRGKRSVPFMAIKQKVNSK